MQPSTDLFVFVVQACHICSLQSVKVYGRTFLEINLIYEAKDSSPLCRNPENVRILKVKFCTLQQFVSVRGSGYKHVPQCSAHNKGDADVCQRSAAPGLGSEPDCNVCLCGREHEPLSDCMVEVT